MKRVRGMHEWLAALASNRLAYVVRDRKGITKVMRLDEYRRERARRGRRAEAVTTKSSVEA